MLLAFSLCMCAVSDGFADMETPVLVAVQVACRELIQLPGWVNGRDVKALWNESKSCRSERVVDNPEMHKTLLIGDVEPAIGSILAARRPKAVKASSRSHCSADALPPLLTSTNGSSRPNPPPPPRTDNAHQSEAAAAAAAAAAAEDSANGDEDESQCEESSDDETASSEGTDNERDDGVPDDVWEELQASKQREKERLRELARIQQELEEARRAEEEARRRHKEELKRIQKEKELKEQERLKRIAQEREARRRQQAEERRRILEEKRQRWEEERRKREETQRRLRAIGKCPAGFVWHKMGGGWRCSAGGHFVSDEELHRRFGGTFKSAECIAQLI